MSLPFCAIISKAMNMIDIYIKPLKHVVDVLDTYFLV